jgi:SAM-dependent methyltransferase
MVYSCPMTTLPTTMETTACPMCGQRQEQQLFVGGDLLHPTAERFRLVNCLNCGHLFQNPRPTATAIDRYYPPEYMPFLRAIEDEPSLFKRLERSYGRAMRCQRVHRMAGKVGRLLDVGCATGIFLDGMRRLGWQVQGVEPSASAVAYARSRFGLDVFEGRLEDAHYPANHFDVITLWDVLEHVHEPRQVLGELARIMRPGGLLVMSLPNPDSLEARLIGEHWLGWDLPRHLNLFRPMFLRTHLAEAGFATEAIQSFTAGYSVLLMSLEQQLASAGRNPQTLLRLLRSMPMRLLARLYYSGPANWFNLSSIMVVFARKHDVSHSDAE